MTSYKNWHMTNVPPETDKYDTHKIWCLTKMVHNAENGPKVICQGLSLAIDFWNEIVKFAIWFKLIVMEF